MTLILTVLAAGIATLLYFSHVRSNGRAENNYGVLALMYWGAALMWCVDGIANIAGGEGFVELSDKAAMLDDALLGLVVVGVGFVLWKLAVTVRSKAVAR